MSLGVPVDARLVSAGDPLFHCPRETYSEGLAMGMGTCSWRFAKCSISSGHERAQTGARGWWSHRILHPSSRACVSRFSRVRLFAILWSLPGSSVHEILQVRILERVAVPFSRGSSPTQDCDVGSGQEGAACHWLRKVLG